MHTLLPFYDVSRVILVWFSNENNFFFLTNFLSFFNGMSGKQRQQFNRMDISFLNVFFTPDYVINYIFNFLFEMILKVNAYDVNGVFFPVTEFIAVIPVFRQRKTSYRNYILAIQKVFN